LFAASVRRWRNHRRLTQEELAERAHLHRTYISDVERGARNLSLESIDKLARALEISVPCLFTPAPAPGLPGGFAPSPFTTPAMPLVDILLVQASRHDVSVTLEAFHGVRFANSVRVVPGGAEALELFFGSGGFLNQLPDRSKLIVLLDLDLPNVSGLEVLRQLKADERTRGIQVVILTASDKDRNIVECRRLGAQAFITKPFSFHGLSKVTPALSVNLALLKPTPDSGN
jgi:CheY-like chemotaxis protein/DNA-binding XRE family transcriptional regulator